jgi:hypothetical protein
MLPCVELCIDLLYCSQAFGTFGILYLFFWFPVYIQWGAVPLEDNVPCDTYYYQLSVYTGIRKNAGTGSKPSFILSGDDGDSGVRVLFDGKRKVTNTMFTFCRFAGNRRPELFVQAFVRFSTLTALRSDYRTEC